MDEHIGKQTGFTLIELMIVVAIIAILASIAMGAYQTFVTRAQVSEGLSLAGTARGAIWEFVANNGRLPNSNPEAGLPAATMITGKYVTSVEIINTGVQITYGGEANLAIKDATLILQPSFSAGDGSVQWSCIGGSISMLYRGSACRQ